MVSTDVRSEDGELRIELSWAHGLHDRQTRITGWHERIVLGRSAREGDPGTVTPDAPAPSDIIIDVPRKSA